MNGEGREYSRRGDKLAKQVTGALGYEGDDIVEIFRDAYRVTFEYLAPLMVRVADEMLVDLRADMAAGRVDRIVALGRDGYSLSVAMHKLEPRFARKNISDVVLSRALVENALQDLERHLGKTFPQVDGFRRVAARVDPANTVGGFRQLDRYLRASRVPVGQPGSRVTLFDTSFKGTVQELLSAVYPETTFTGRYAFFGESPHDPHPGSKQGYEVHLPAASSREGRPFYELPDDETKTFAHQLALNSIEELLDGPWSSPVRIKDARPEQRLQGFESRLLDGLSPARLSARLLSPTIREGVKIVNLHALADRAQLAAETRKAGRDPRPRLEEESQRYRSEIRAWITGQPAEPRLTEFLNSFVHRTDKQQVEQLQRMLERSDLPFDSYRKIWTAYDQCASDDDKRVFVQNVQSSVQATGGRDGREPGPRPPRRMDGPGRTGRDL
ncbi:ABC transporter permease [Kribbella antibiotica]|uniref:ABC transporter permease n=1 Tax=Kribbella antibiotica TaxID=190195 RepID=UPI00140524C3|nr:ABC transporter permease [Kribbella antibiotica]